MDRPLFATRAEYGKRFTDSDYWRPYIAEICARHLPTIYSTLRIGLPGSHPVFIIDDKYVIKLYSDMFGGASSYPLECALYTLMAAVPTIPAPILLATGQLFATNGDWPWPYTITQRIAGQSLGESNVSYADRLAVATWLGSVVRHIHSLPLTSTQPLLPEWTTFAQFLSEQRANVVANHTRWGSLPAHLVAQIDNYVPAIADLLNEHERPALIHADLNGDHVLGEMVGANWRPTGIIDFGDAKVGDRIYELIALHFGMFQCDKRLLSTFLTAYNFDAELRRDFVRRAMCMSLLFEFNAFENLLKYIPVAIDVSNLEELARLIWDGNL